jgi:hypothetical protein
MNDGGLGDVWTLVIPRFDKIFGGGVEAITPILVLIIWGVAAFVWYFARSEAHRGKALVDETSRLFDDLEPGELWIRRNAIAATASTCSPEVRDAWREFDETLVTENRRLFNTVDAAEYFNEHRFAPRLVGNRFLHAAPTALTTLGLLGTFFGLTVGLRGLNLGSTTDELRVGVQTLVNGAALGFTASLWGVAMSLLTTVHERWQERQVLRTIQALQGRINRLFTMRSPEQSLSDIASHSSESKEALQVLHEKIGSALQESVQQLGENTSSAVSQAIHESLTPIMTDLAKHAADQSANVFKEISGQLTASFNEIGVSLASELKASSESMRVTLDYMGEQLARHADQHLARLTALEEATFAQLRAVNDATTRQMVMLEESMPRIITGLDETASLVGSATLGMESVTTSLTRVSTEIGETSTGLARMLSDAIGTMDELAGKTSTAAHALAEQQGTISNLTDRTVAAAGVMQEASGVLRGGFDGMRSAQSAFLADLQQQLVKHSEAMSAWLAAYAGEVSKQTAHRMGEWNAQTDRFTSTMLNATQALSDAIDELSVARTEDDRSAVA